MRIPVDSVVDAVKMGASVQGDVDAPVRVAVYLDAGAPSHIVSWLRDALVPQTTSGLVRVARLDAPVFSVKADTDVALVVSSGSPLLQDRVQQIVIAGVPTVILCESSVEVPFIQQDTAMLGLIAASDATHLLSSLARWILDRTDKDTAFAANFAFMRIAAAMRVVRSATMANLATGALFFMPGADFPVMTMTQLGMMLKLAGRVRQTHAGRARVRGRHGARRCYRPARRGACGGASYRAPGCGLQGACRGCRYVRHGVLPQRLLRARYRLRSSERLFPRGVFACEDPARPCAAGGRVGRFAAVFGLPLPPVRCAPVRPCRDDALSFPTPVTFISVKPPIRRIHASSL